MYINFILSSVSNPIYCREIRRVQSEVGNCEGEGFKREGGNIKGMLVRI